MMTPLDAVLKAFPELTLYDTKFIYRMEIE
jgi:hypothetical protein